MAFHAYDLGTVKYDAMHIVIYDAVQSSCRSNDKQTDGLPACDKVYRYSSKHDLGDAHQGLVGETYPAYTPRITFFIVIFGSYCVHLYFFLSFRK